MTFTSLREVFSRNICSLFSSSHQENLPFDEDKSKTSKNLLLQLNENQNSSSSSKLHSSYFAANNNNSVNLQNVGAVQNDEDMHEAKYSSSSAFNNPWIPETPQNLNLSLKNMKNSVKNDVLEDVAAYSPESYGSSYPTPQRFLDDPEKIPSVYVFQSNMVTDEDLKPGMLRNLEVDKRLTLPTRTHIRFLVTAGDVIHSWAVPSLGIKADAVPGRLQRVNCFILREGVFYGQCSELCGALHGFMPIVVEAVSPETYAAHARKFYRD